MPNTDYTFFNTENFLDDADFLRYVKYNYTEDISFWENWQATSPKNLNAFREAKLQLQIILSTPPILASNEFKASLFQDINNAIQTHQSTKRNKTIRLIWSAGIAASLFVAAFVGWFYQSTIVIHADYAENKLVRLPDGSDIRLNANSTLTYRRAFNWLAKRTVELDGEAYFKVKHINVNAEQIKKGELFIAITKNAQIQVLGTEFNLKERHRKTNVALVKGKIKVSSNKTGKSYIMLPGDMIDLSENGTLVEKPNQLDNQTAWLTGKIVVSQTSVNEIIKEFEDLYGYKVILDSPALGRKKIDGAISIQSEESLLFTLKNILNVNIEKEGKTIYLKNR